MCAGAPVEASLGQAEEEVVDYLEEDWSWMGRTRVESICGGGKSHSGMNVQL